VIDRIVSAIVGAAAGVALCVGFDLFSSGHGIGSVHWSLSGPVRWFAAAGALIGFLGGREVAHALWTRATDELRDDATSTLGTGAVILVFVSVAAAVIFLAVR